ncbi:hypothetical protein EDD11_006718 [Mortierella claussenii]|nr:hypothetical protein EDD11_006718 [Mortierella claussenii]
MKVVSSAGSTLPLSSSSRSPFSTITAPKQKLETHSGSNRQRGTDLLDRPSTTTATATATTNASVVEGDVIYRKEGSKIVPVESASHIEAPVSGLFSQFEDFVKPASSTSLPTAFDTPKRVMEDGVDLSALTLEDVLPPNEFVKQLIQQQKYNITVDELKELLQSVLDVLPLSENDPKRLQAEKTFVNACKKRNVVAYEVASWTLKYTRGGAPLAFALFKMAVDHGDYLSKYSYALLLYRGAKGVPTDRAKGRAILESLAKPKRQVRGFPPAMSTLASIYARDDHNFEAARDLYLAAANGGMVEARVALGRMYLSGELPKDLAKAKECFKYAVKSEDNAEAHFLLAAMEMEAGKDGKQPNLKDAFQHYQKAASMGLPEAQYNVGLAYFRGLGVPKNEDLAVEYWKMSGQQGFGLAQLSLGAYYFQDETPQQPSKQEQQEQGGAVVAKHEWDPSKKDLMQAQKWFTLASRRPGQLGEEGQRLKAQVDEAIKKGRGGSKDGRACIIM